MSQFLGVGSSGVFAIDHTSTAKPYDVCGRAQALDELSKNEADPGLFSFGCRLDDRLQPQEPPNVKWVNWRWPRYEWEAEFLDEKTNTKAKVKVCRQWVVHGRAVLAQTTLQNLSQTHLENLQCYYQTEMLIRELDYVEPRHTFNEDSLEDKSPSRYKQFPAPRGFGRVTVHDLDTRPYTGTNVGTRVKNRPSVDSQRENVSEHGEHTKKASAMEESTTSNIAIGRRRSDELHHEQTVGSEYAHEHSQNAPRPEEDQSAEQIKETATRDAGEDGGKIQVRDDKVLDKIRQIQDTWSRKQTKSVASVMITYRNGLAVEMNTESTSDGVIQLGPNGRDEDICEIVTAYKLVPLPGKIVDWRNFFLTPKEVDVSEILREETIRFWGQCKGSGQQPELCNFGLSVMDMKESTQDAQKFANAADEGFNATGEAVAEAVHEKMSSTHADIPSGDSTAKDQEGNHGATSRSTPGSSGFSSPNGPPDGSSPKDHIEFLLRRHLEHVLSVCAVPLMRFDLVGEDPVEKEEDAQAFALTCGDMSGHRVCTSAS
ncbi:hypothetical protein N8I77_007171 [Diaporthe amygdali]|uniref:Uncharacterized protein n=1 Tax=Phomopsis amygdali TaxID=1214568 RepID=A0AAD9W1M0_PHOAM|nr:hypothetical protein N8I77_007171 [Diaporthe amygdali]